MASYLQQTDPRIYQTTPFLPNRDAINTALMYRQGKYDEGVARIQGVQNNILNLDISNEENKVRLNEYYNKAKEQLTKMSKSDFSLRDNVVAAEKIFDPITEDKYITNDISTTKFFRQQFEVAKELKTKDKGIGFNATNLRYVQNAYEKFTKSTGNDQFNIQKREYVPYTDVIAEINKVADDMKVKVTRDITAPGGYIITKENGDIAYGPLRDMFYSNLSDQAKGQLKIESVVGYEEASKLVGEDVAALEVSDKYASSLTRQIKENSAKLAEVRKNIQDIEKLGDKATVQQREYLDLYKNQESILDSNQKGAERTFKTMSGWSIDDKKKYAEQLSNEMYVEARAHNWARSRADVTSSFKIDKDQAYWTGLELDRQREKALLEAAEGKSSKKTKEEKEAEEAAVAADLTQGWTPLGPNKLPEENIVDYTSITKNMFDASSDLLSYKRSALDEYWGKKAEGSNEIFTKISKAVENGSGKLKITDLANAYSSDTDVTTDLDLEKYAKALGIPSEELSNMSVSQVYNRMNSGFNDYMTNAETVPNADIKPYEYKNDLKKKEDVYAYYKEMHKKINQTASREITKMDFKLGKDTYNESMFLNPDGTLKTKEQAVQELLTLDKRPNSNPTGVGGIMPSTAPGLVIAPAGVKDAARNTALEKIYDTFANRYNKARNDSAKNLSRNIVYNKFYATNDPKEINDRVDVIARRLAYNFEGPNLPLIADQFTSEELERYVPRLNNTLGNSISSVEMTPFPNGENEYILKFDRSELIKLVDSKDVAGKEWVDKLVTTGVRIKAPNNIPELSTTRDLTRFLIDNDRKVERKFGDNYNFSLYRTNGPKGITYNVSGTRTVPEVNSDGSLVIENGAIKFKKEPVDIALDVNRNTIDGHLNNLASTFYKMNAIYIYANRSDVLAKMAKDPKSLKTLSQLTSLAASEYKLDLNLPR